jgi:MFS family permease
MLLFGKIYTFYSTKMVFLSAIGLFEIGSAICSAAPNSTAFIVGRAIAGLGSSGIFGGAIVIMVHTIPLAKRTYVSGTLWSGVGHCVSCWSPPRRCLYTIRVVEVV